jgi:PAS domain S-box-containing protein
MHDSSKTDQELLEEIAILKQRIRELEQSEFEHKGTEDVLVNNKTWGRVLFEHSPDGIVIIEPDTARLLEFNETAHQQLGYSREEFLRLSIYDIDVSETPDETRSHIQKVIRDGRSDFETIHRTREGEIRNIRVMAQSTEILGRSVYHCIWRDITDRKRADKALRESEENFRIFFTTVDDMIIVASPGGTFIYTNPAMTLKLGYSANEFKNMHVLDVHPLGMRQEAEIIFAGMLKRELAFCPLPLQSKTGALIPAETRVWFGKWNGEDCIFGISKDLTKEQEALQKFNRLFNSNPSPMAVSSVPEGRFTDVNEAFLNTLGYSRGEIIGKTSEELGLFLQPEKQKEVAEQLQAQDRIANCELKVKRKEGTILDGLFSGETIESQGIKCLLTVMIDQTERKRAEEAWRESEARWQFALEGAGDGVWDWNTVTNRVYFSNQWKTMLGYAEYEIGDTLDEWDRRVHPEDKTKVFADLERHFLGETDTYQNEHRVLCKDGSYKWILDRGKVIEWTVDKKPLRMIGTHTDVSERKQAKDILEKIVKERTIELSSKNQLLAKEVKERSHVEAALRKKAKEVQHKADKLVELNAALKVILRQREEDKEELEDKVLANITNFITPDLEKLKKQKIDQDSKSILEMVEANLNNIISPFGSKLSSKYLKLTPTEIKVANLVKEGKSIKEIAEIMTVSHHTIDLHRFNLRKKMGLKSRKINLRSYLLSLS